MDLFLGVVPLGPILAQLLVSFFEVLLVKGHLPQAVDVGLYSNVVEVLQFCINQSAEGKLSIEPVKVALM